MRIARFWAKEETSHTLPDGTSVPLSVWDWSESSHQEAREKARHRLHDIAQKARSIADLRQRSQGYGYGDKPPREEIVEEIRDAKSEVVATITRNIYGALVLNTSRLMFIDVDLPGEPVFAFVHRLVSALKGKKYQTRAAQTQAKLQTLTASHADLGMRLYKTAAGFRCVVTSCGIDATSSQAQQLFDEFGADPLYVRLSNNQGCFRARLTPKYWRIAGTAPPHRFPFDSTAQQEEYRRWQEEYSMHGERYAVCREMNSGEEMRRQAVAAEIESLLELHDRYTKVRSDLPLA